MFVLRAHMAKMGEAIKEKIKSLKSMERHFKECLKEISQCPKKSSNPTSRYCRRFEGFPTLTLSPTAEQAFDLQNNFDYAKAW